MVVALAVVACAGLALVGLVHTAGGRSAAMGAGGVALAEAPTSAAGATSDAARTEQPRRTRAPSTSADPGYAAIVEDEAYWVSTAQLTCTGDGAGAIAEARIVGTGLVSVHPYEANIGARAMVAAGGRYLPMVRHWIDWYLSKLNAPDTSGVDGTVYDYDYDPVTCAGRFQQRPGSPVVPTYDSTDAYAGTFLTLVAEYARADPAAARALDTAAVRAGLVRVADAIGATRKPSGLTAATPTYDAEYLLDNVEAQRGLADYAWLLDTVFGDPAAASARAAEAAAMRDAVERVLWTGSHSPGLYAVAADRLDPSWDVWFPDSLAQLWPVMAGLGDQSRRSALWTGFSARWPGWQDSTPAYGTISPDHDPNSSVAYAAAVLGDGAALDAYLRSSQARWIDTGRPPPWTVDDSGFRALAAQVGLGR
ncbi:hypothetical protein PSU4_45840 [Pseudonocardia sulfidoxydans NBRC 16205]|uniref:Uncharacterized protein n=1 Tax=Pseudonocardia sulfidoxydans NBRC 16205 TaxID=1223511 RepID=A0A511DLE6_9PSEU|nr:hypothetical protein PSU4_45840 [Pseudonocardia sulfidoxydans NBRC 16205]